MQECSTVNPRRQRKGNNYHVSRVGLLFVCLHDALVLDTTCNYVLKNALIVLLPCRYLACLSCIDNPLAPDCLFPIHISNLFNFHY